MRTADSVVQYNFVRRWKCSLFALLDIKGTSRIWVPSLGNLVAEELDFKFYLLLINLNSHTWPLAASMDSAGPEDSLPTHSSHIGNGHRIPQPGGRWIV